MVAKKGAVIAGMCIGMMLLGGCEMLEPKEKWEPKEPSAISISEEGVITEYINEVLDEAFYSASELKTMIDTEVSAYNSKNGADSVVVKEFVEEGQNIRLTMEYAGAEDYAEFNNVEFYYGSMINAQLSGYLFDGAYKRVSGGVVQGSPVSGSEVLKKMAAEVLIVTAPLEIELPGSVVFTSTNADVLADDVVDATGKVSGQEENGLVLPSNAVYKGEEKSFDERTAANRVYIIFEKE